MQSNSEALAVLDPDTLERPKSRIGPATNARKMVSRLKKDERIRNSRKTKIDGIVDGNPPWNPKRLTDLQQGHRANFNLREAEGAVETAKTPYYDLLFEVDKFAQIKFNYDLAPPDIIC